MKKSFFEGNPHKEALFFLFPRFGRSSPFITCTLVQVGNLSATLTLPTSNAAKNRAGRPAYHDGSPESQGRNVGLKRPVTHQAGNLCDYDSIPRSKTQEENSSIKGEKGLIRKEKPGVHKLKRPVAKLFVLTRLIYTDRLIFNGHSIYLP